MATGITLLQAVLLGVVFYVVFLGLGYTFTGGAVFSTLTMSFLVGLVLGDVKTAMIIGAQLQLMYMGIIAPGSAMPAVPCVAALVATTIGVAAGLDASVAVAIAVPVGLLGVQLYNLQYMINVAWVHLADKYAEKGDANGVFFASVIVPNLAKIILIIPLVVVLKVGPDLAENIMAVIPAWLLNGIAAVGKLMPALGFAIIVTQIGKMKLLPYFLLGFLVVQYLGIPTLPLALFGVIIAFLHLTFTNQLNVTLLETASAEADVQPVKRILAKKDITGYFLRWWAYAETNHNFERLQSSAFCAAMVPILKKLYKTKDDMAAALQRHLTFFNTEACWGGVIPGITIAMEEQKALGADIPDEAILGIKTGLMGPFAGIGDTLDTGMLLPILLSLFLPLASNGSWTAGVFPIALFAIITVLIGLWMCHLGYRLGSQSAVQILKSGAINTIIIGASVLGLFMMGGLAASYITVSTPLTIVAGDGSFVVQDILNSILKGLLPLLSVIGVYMFLNKSKKGRSYVVATLLLFVIGLVLGALGIIA